MQEQSISLIRILSLAAIAGNILFLLWILYNGISENFAGTVPEKISYITLMGLLAVNAYLISRGKNR